MLRTTTKFLQTASVKLLQAIYLKGMVLLRWGHSSPDKTVVICSQRAASAHLGCAVSPQQCAWSPGFPLCTYCGDVVLLAGVCKLRCLAYGAETGHFKLIWQVQ